MKKIPLLVIFIVAAISFKAIAGNNDSALNAKITRWMDNTGGLRFLENKGQMMDMQRKAVPNVLYEASEGGMNVYVTTDGLSYVFTKMDKHKKANSSAMPNKMGPHSDAEDSVTVQYCRADMELTGADIRKENIIKEDESSDRTDYYYGDVCPNGILGVHSYGKITIKNIYPGIDWVLHTGANGLKYDFIVHPGADPSLIRLKYKWTDKPELQDDGSVKISTPMGNITEGIPVSYTTDKRNKIQTTYNIDGNEIHFNVGTYNSAQTLTIDPTLVWATYYSISSPAVVEVFSMQEDGTNVWITGTTTSPFFPTFNPGGGAYFLGTLNASQHAYILQFSTTGALKWATYYGGGIDQSGLSIYSDGSNVWVTGSTNSPNFPTLNPGGGAYFQGALAGSPGSANAFILQFSTAGVLKWATYYGGSVNDGGYSIQSDGRNVWVTGCTSSPNFPTLNPGGGAYFQGVLAGNGNVFILQFNILGVRKWATYYGGSGIKYYGDYGYSINSDGANVWVTGHTTSSNFPTYNPGKGAYFQGTLLAGYGDAFILEFDTTGVRKWATYYGGWGNGSLGDAGHSIQSDGRNVWVTGYTSSTNFPTLNPGGGAYFQGTLAGVYGSAFILKFDTTGVRKWATYYGGSGNKYSDGDIGYSIQSDGRSVWVCGSTNSTDFPMQNPGCGFFQDTSGSISNYGGVFILQFNTAGVCKWGTYYGTDMEDDIGGDGTYIWSDGRNLFIGGDASVQRYPTVNPGGGAYFDKVISANSETVFVGKFIIADSGKLVVSPTVSICRGDTTTIIASGAISYSWSPPAGLSATNIPNPIASPTVTTTYTIIGAGGCAGTLIDSVKVIVDTFKSNINITKDTSICSGGSITLIASGGGNYQWNTGDTTTSISIKNDSTTHIYTVSISNGVCKKDTSVKVSVNVKPKGNVSGNLFICNGNSTTLAASGGTSYKWSTGATTSNITISPSSNTTYSVEIIQNGCADTLSESITVASSPNINICCDSTIVAGQKVQLISSGGGTYQWFPATGLSCVTCSDPIASPNQTTTYTLTISNDSGCIVQSFVTIDIGCGNVFVPDVFSPNEAHNNIFYVRGTCIVTMDFLVFDRWGNKVFESENPNIGWDGDHNGQPMNTGTYVWYLKATLLDGTSIEKKGNLTLIR